jgi:hypothetical protein
MRKYISIPFIKGLLLTIVTYVTLVYIILPGLTIDNIILNILSFILLCIGSMAIILGVSNYIKNKLN